MIYPLVRELAAQSTPARVPVAVTCRVLGFSKQAYYQWCAKPVSDRDLDEAYLTNAAVDAHRDDPAFGYRFIADELATNGYLASERRVWRLCSQQKLFSVFSKKAGPARRTGPPVHDDLVARRFTATEPNQLWLTDLTEHRTNEGKLYLCAIKDVYSNRIVGYSIGDRMKASLAVAALRMAIHRRGYPSGTVVHSDRGSQFRSNRYVRTLANNGLIGSMGRVGACADNAAMESFFSLLQNNVLDTRRWETRERPAPSDHHLDRADIPPPATPAHPQQAHPNRVRDTQQPGYDNRRCLKITSQRALQQPRVPPNRCSTPAGTP